MKKRNHKSLALYEQPQDYYYHNHTVSPVTDPNLPVDFTSDPEVVRLVVEGERLTYGHLFNPAFATEISMIEPLPHQRIAVYDHMLQQPRLRFLLADDAGAGKTIMTGLYIREMLTRRLISRVLIVPPAGLVGNWEHEMHSLFNLPFTIVVGNDARSGNPFTGPQSDLLIVSVDTLRGDSMFSRLQEAEVIPYDLVIFDEAHKLAADREADFRVRKTDRYRLAEALAGIAGDDPRWELSWSCHHLLLLTATPHMGKDFPYYCLWRLLEPDALSTIDAFNAYPMDARHRHFIRRTKEELVYFDERPIYPPRISNTLSYDLSKGEVSEQELYNATTAYIQTYYNSARVLNRSAARLAMSVFQRRLASSTYALLRSFERRYQKLVKLIDDMRAGRLTPTQLETFQRKLGTIDDVFEKKTADEEEETTDQEENERVEDQELEGVIATSLAELEVELHIVEGLLHLARQVYEAGEESKFEKLREVLRDPRYQDHKLIIFTEHRDTLEFLVRRLEGLGFTDQVAQIHGGKGYQEREEQVAFFRRPIAEGGAKYLVATDAAGEGINLQVCWLMVNYDIPWNPARLEQRIGRLFQGISLREYMERVMLTGDEHEVQRQIEGTLTRSQVEAIEESERTLFGDGGSVKSELPRLRATIEQETYLKLLPGYVRRFIEKAVPLLDIGIEGNLDTFFSFRPLKPGTLDWLLPVLEIYPPELRTTCTVHVPGNSTQGIFLHPGEPVFDRFRSFVCECFQQQAMRGAVFIDPTAKRPYLYHLAQIVVSRKADPDLPTYKREEILEYRLVGLKQELDGEVEECPVEQLLLLHGSQDIPAFVHSVVATMDESCDHARAFALAQIAETLAEHHRQQLLQSLPERQDFIERGFAYQVAELADARRRWTDKANAGDVRAKGELTRIKTRQQALKMRKAESLAVINREPELIAPGNVLFLAHAFVIPSNDPVDKMRYDADVEAIAIQRARAFEEALGGTVRDVSTPERALAAGLGEWPGFDLLSHRPSGEELAIEVKGRASIGDVELSENEWIRACNHRDRYWLYVVYDCAKSFPMLRRVRDPFGKLIVRTKERVVIDEQAIFAAAEEDETWMNV